MTQNYKGGQIKDSQLGEVILKNFLRGKLTYLHWNKGEEMVPTIDEKAVTLVRKLPLADPK